jgi:hypothetical protein
MYISGEEAYKTVSELKDISVYRCKMCSAEFNAYFKRVPLSTLTAHKLSLPAGTEFASKRLYLCRDCIEKIMSYLDDANLRACLVRLYVEIDGEKYILSSFNNLYSRSTETEKCELDSDSWPAVSVTNGIVTVIRLGK